MSSTNLLCVSMFLGVVSFPRSLAVSSQFLGPQAVLIEGMTANEARTFNAEIESVFGRTDTSARLTKLEDALRPIYVTFSSSGKHGLGHAATRYALHRYFQQRHGWRVTGIDSKGQAWNDSSATDFLEGKVPDYVRSIFDERLTGDGLDLHGVAVLAATVEHIVRIETATRLEQAYATLDMSTDAWLSSNDVDQLMDMHMLLTFFGDRVPMAKMKQLYRLAHKVYPGWEDTQLFLRDLRLNRAYASRETTNPFMLPPPDFDNMLHLVEEVNDQHGQFQDLECQALKQILLTAEHRGTGRVRLPDFYGLAVSGHPQFVEREEYLRDIGVLDETNETAPAVMVANWLYSEANCLGASAHYRICCVNECNSLMAHLERDLRIPRVPVEQLAAAAARLSSSTVAAPRNLSSTLTRRLQEIALTHNGVVPLHGRLFAQWMHHAFPRECPYPAVAGTVQSLSTRAWKAANGGKAATLNKEELQNMGRKPVDAAVQDGDEDTVFDDSDWPMDEELERQAQWEGDEEIFIAPGEEGKAKATLLRTIAVLAAVVSVIAMLVQSVLSAHVAKSHSSSKEKYVV